MLPLSLLRTAQTHQMLVELKNGETYNGILVNCDNWMNINLRKVTCTSKDGDKFWHMPTVYIRGNTIKYLGIPDNIIDLVQEEEVQVQKASHPQSGAGRGDGRGRGRGRGGGRGGFQQGGRGGGGDRGGRGGGRGGGDRGGRGRGAPKNV